MTILRFGINNKKGNPEQQVKYSKKEFKYKNVIFHWRKWTHRKVKQEKIYKSNFYEMYRKREKQLSAELALLLVE